LLIISQIEKHNHTALVVSVNGVEHPAVRDEELNVLVIFDANTYLPHIVRSFEDHAIFGITTNDLQLFDYVVVSGIQFPQRRMVIYNGNAILEDTTVAAITADPGFPEDFFSGLDASETETTPAPPAKIEGYSHAEIGEYWYNTFWGGEYTGTYQNVSVTQPVEELPGVHWLLVRDSPNLQQLVLEFEDSLIVFEAPPHQTDLVIRWVNETLGKPITHLWVSAKLTPQRSELIILNNSLPIITMIMPMRLGNMSNLGPKSSCRRFLVHCGTRFQMLNW
jgi:hypothetical protein